MVNIDYLANNKNFLKKFKKFLLKGNIWLEATFFTLSPAAKKRKHSKTYSPSLPIAARGPASGANPG